jgi:hypothetical protein
VAIWVTFIALGAVFEFLGRFLGTQGNPSGIWISWAPLLVTLVAALVVGAGVLRLMRDGKQWAVRDVSSSDEGTPSETTYDFSRLRTGALICATGALMLAASFVAKAIITTVL